MFARCCGIVRACTYAVPGVEKFVLYKTQIVDFVIVLLFVNRVSLSSSVIRDILYNKEIGEIEPQKNASSVFFNLTTSPRIGTTQSHLAADGSRRRTFSRAPIVASLQLDMLECFCFC